jgi:hypothetical protein
LLYYTVRKTFLYRGYVPYKNNNEFGTSLFILQF